MSEVGTYVDLWHLNDKPKQQQEKAASGRLWDVGTYVKFVRFAESISMPLPVLAK